MTVASKNQWTVVVKNHDGKDIPIAIFDSRDGARTRARAIRNCDIDCGSVKIFELVPTR